MLCVCVFGSASGEWGREIPIMIFIKHMIPCMEITTPNLVRPQPN